MKEYSHYLERDMEYNIYGSRGLAVLVFPAQNGRFYDYENFGMVDVISTYIDDGKIQLFCVDSIDLETWSDEYGDPAYRIALHEKWYNYICEELCSRIHEINSRSEEIGILTTGVSMGATHAANFMLRRPDLFMGTIALSGYYDSDLFFGDYHDDLIYMNSPIQYLGGMSTDHEYVQMYNHSYIILCTGQGAWEDESRYSMDRIEEQFHRLGVDAWCDRWGYDVNHDWPWWFKQMPYFLDKILIGGI